MMDWDISHAFGRPCMILEEEYVTPFLCLISPYTKTIRSRCSIDVPLLTECDDEHWTHGESGTTPQQPLGKPSKLSFYNCFIRLARILAYATRTIVRTPPAFEVATVIDSNPRRDLQYAIRRSHAPADYGDQQQRIVAELDSSLNQWADSVPAHRAYRPFSNPPARPPDSRMAPRSQMGPSPRRRRVPAPVREPPRVLLPSAGVRAPRVHPPVPRVAALLPVADHLHQRRAGVHPAPRRALRAHRDARLPEPGAHPCPSLHAHESRGTYAGAGI